MYLCFLTQGAISPAKYVCGMQRWIDRTKVIIRSVGVCGRAKGFGKGWREIKLQEIEQFAVFQVDQLKTKRRRWLVNGVLLHGEPVDWSCSRMFRNGIAKLVTIAWIKGSIFAAWCWTNARCTYSRFHRYTKHHCVVT